ncbi:MAG: ABC transporter permease, partial [FCB group bacterium]|nr:ABC transporter permease [FCB group bacterium]
EMGLIQGALIAPLMSMGADRNIRQTVVNQITTEYGYLEPAHLDQIIAEVSASFEKMKGEISTSMESQIKMTPLVRAEQADWGLIQAVAGTVVMMLLFSVAGMGTGLLLEREEGTLKRLLMSPISPNSILFGKLLSALVVGVSQILVVFVFAWIVFDLDLMINLPAVILMVIATAWACSSFGIFLAAISTSRKQVEMLSTLIILIMSAIGGSMIPLPVMPAIMQDLAVISVNYWSIQGFFDIFWRQLPLVDILPRLLVLTGIGAFLIFLSQLFFRRNLSKLV